MTTRRVARRRFLGTAAALLAVLGCGRYPEVSSPESLRLLAALRTACSTRNEQRLAKAEQAIEKAHGGGKINEQERASFAAIIQKARQGKWERAHDDCLAFQKAQVR